ncbi:tetratricopeptide repeat protein 39B-like [Scleropages formosus]|uniref:Tetratricopeptide repeat protein 39B n=1 Tax=Scleropages formosus TaxID=113540 RepID=A0A8C9S2S0_SCLFO|nr:tetratricopeptide repeat protein 39B-like [Scleropages formosus]
MTQENSGTRNAHVDEESFEDAFEGIPEASQMDLKTAIQECCMALSLFLNNRFCDALDLLRPWAKKSMYHALGYSSILVMQAGLTFAHKDIQTAMEALRESLETCQGFRKKNTVVETISNLVYRQGAENFTEEEMHAEICYAETLMQKAALSFVEDESMISFLKAGIKIRTSYLMYKECQNLLNTSQDLTASETFNHFKGGINMGIGSFNLMLSLLPSRVLRLLEFIGFSGNREVGLSQLRQGATNQSLRSILSALTLLMYNTYVTVILGTGEGNLVEAEALLQPYLEKFPNGCIILFYVARIGVLKGNFEMAQAKFLQCIAIQQEWRQVHHLCYWELMWIHCFQQQWMEAYRYADLLSKESKWSQATYVFQKAAILSMLPEEEVQKTGEDVTDLFRQVDSLRLRMAGKSIPTEKFAARKARRYCSPTPVKLVIPALEMMYVWNGFTIVGKRAELTESLLSTIEKAEEKLREYHSPTEYCTDDQCLVQLLKGLCLKHLGRHLQAELCFTQVISSEKRIKYDHYLVPFSLYELGLLYKMQGDIPKAITFIENAKQDYKKYSMESRLHFRIHAALDSMTSSPIIAK